MNTLRTSFLVAALTVSALAPLSANTVLDFNSSSYVSANVNLTFTGSGIAFSGSTALTPSSDYSGPALYGGVSRIGDNSFSLMRVNDGGTSPQTGVANDYLLFRYNNATVTNASTLGVLLMGQTSNVSFDSTSSISWSAARVAGTGHSGNVRAVILIDGTYYISQSTVNLTSTYGSANMGNLTTLNWTTYTPGTSLFYSNNGNASIALSSIDAVGILMTVNIPASGGTGNKDIWLGQLTVTAIPEPSAFAALAGLGALGLAASRRRRRA